MVEVPSILTDIFGMSEHFFEWPFIITELFLPFILFTYTMKLVFDKLRIFKSDFVNWGLAAIVSLSSIFFISSIGPLIITLCVFMIWVLKEGGLKGLALGILSALITFYGFPIFVNYLTSMVP